MVQLTVDGQFWESFSYDFRHGFVFLSFYSKKETCLKIDSRVFSEGISLKQDNLSSKFAT